MTAHAKMRLLAVFSSLPLIGFIFIAAILYQRIFAGDPQVLPSALIGKPVPEFALPALAGSGMPSLAAKDLHKGRVTLVNVWASWCIPCRTEHPLLMQLGSTDGFHIVGLNYKDAPGAALKFLKDNGNPYARIGIDADGRAGIDLGVYGVPESFIVGGDGRILYKHVGPLNPDVVQNEILPRLLGEKT